MSRANPSERTTLVARSSLAFASGDLTVLAERPAEPNLANFRPRGRE